MPLDIKEYLTKGPGFGAMSLSGMYGPTDDTNGLAVLKAAYDAGCYFWDSASIYGLGHNERLIGRFFAENEGSRDKVFVASKCAWDFEEGGPVTSGVTNSPTHIYSMIDKSIERLGTNPDLYYLHRRDPNTPLEESIAALDKIKKDGKTRFIGISECSAATLRAACKIARIDAIQIEYSPFMLEPETNDLLSTAAELGVVVVAFSPLGAGVLTGAFTDPSQFANDLRGDAPRFQGEAFKKNFELVRKFEAIAKDKGCASGQLALAWVSKQGALPIPGTKSVGRLTENVGARDVNLSDEDLARIREVIKVGVQGERWGEGVMAFVGK